MSLLRCQTSRTLRATLCPANLTTAQLHLTEQPIPRFHTVCIVGRALGVAAEDQSLLFRRRNVRSLQTICLPGTHTLNLEPHLMRLGRPVQRPTLRPSPRLPGAKNAKLSTTIPMPAALPQCQASWIKTVNTDLLMIPAQQGLESRTLSNRKNIGTTLLLGSVRSTPAPRSTHCNENEGSTALVVSRHSLMARSRGSWSLLRISSCPCCSPKRHSRYMCLSWSAWSTPVRSTAAKCKLHLWHVFIQLHQHHKSRLLKVCFAKRLTARWELYGEPPEIFVFRNLLADTYKSLRQFDAAISEITLAWRSAPSIGKLG